MRWGLIALKGAAGPVAALAAGLLASRYIGSLAALGPVGAADLAQWSQWTGLAGLGAFLLLYGLFAWRVWRWSEGAGPSCQWCMGPLGGVRDGKVYYGRQLSDYRRCYNCGKPNSCMD